MGEGRICALFVTISRDIALKLPSPPVIARRVGPNPSLFSRLNAIVEAVGDGSPDKPGDEQVWVSVFERAFHIFRPTRRVPWWSRAMDP